MCAFAIILLFSACSGTRLHRSGAAAGTASIHESQPQNPMESAIQPAVDVFHGVSGGQVCHRMPLHSPHLSDLSYTPDACPADPGIIRLLEAILKSQGAPFELSALPWVESSYYIGDYSRVGAAGPWQFMSGTARHFNMNMTDEIDERYSWTASTRTASEYLTYLNRLFNDWHLALAAYNCGEGVVQRALSSASRREYGLIDLPGETDAFVPRYSAALEALRSRERDVPDLSVVLVPPGLDLRLLSAEAGIPVETMAGYNRGFLLEKTPVGQRNWEVVVPTPRASSAFQTAWTINRRDYLVKHGDSWGSVASVLGVTESELRGANNGVMPPPGEYMYIPESGRVPVNSAAAQRAGFYEYTVRSGDTMGGIGASIGVSSREVAAWNDITTSTVIYPGQKLLLRGIPPEGTSQVEIVRAPEAVTHTVEQGDTMWDLATLYGVSVDQIMELNNRDSAELSIGETLLIKPE